MADIVERLHYATRDGVTGENKVRIEEREQLAKMMIRQSLATGHGDTVADLVRELEPQIERLRAENSRLLGLPTSSESVRAVKLEQEVDRLRAEVAECKKDAERYRWLRDVGDANWLPIAKRGITAKECDAAIDAALGGEGK